MRFIVNDEITIFDFLTDNLKDKSKNNIKSLLVNKVVFVNNYVVTKYNYLLQKDDKVYIIDRFIKTNDGIIEILYEDKEFIVVNKPHNLLTIATNKERFNTLYSLVSSYIKKKNKNSKIFIVHRLDKDTSGLVIFAKNEKIKDALQADWNNLAITRQYLALVHGTINKNQRLENYLADDNFNNTYITNRQKGKLAITEFEVIAKKKNSSLLKVLIKTGRKNQIRVQLSNINHPIVGDKKYGIKDNSKRMLLHANKLEIIHPFTKKRLSFSTTIPTEFIK